MSTVTVDLKAAGLTHVKGKSDSCDGEHAIDGEHVTGLAGLVPADGLEELFQRFHEQAHPEGTAYWENCQEFACQDAAGLLAGEPG